MGCNLYFQDRRARGRIVFAMPLEPDEQLRLDAAEGFIYLGMCLEADAALAHIAPFCRHFAEVLAVRVHIYRALEKWELMQVVATKLTEYEPQDVQWWVAWADASRKADSVEAARLILVNGLEGLEQFLDDSPRARPLRVPAREYPREPRLA